MNWNLIAGYDPMEECWGPNHEEIGWIRPRNIGKHCPPPWGTASDWPGEWEAIPHGEWHLSTYCADYQSAKEYIESEWRRDSR